MGLPEASRRYLEGNGADPSRNTSLEGISDRILEALRKAQKLLGEKQVFWRIGQSKSIHPRRQVHFVGLSHMSTDDEIATYSDAPVSSETGEIEDYDGVLLSRVIRSRELNAVKFTLRLSVVDRILDFGCGGGWLSKILSQEGYDVVGVDISQSLIMSAKMAAPNASFVVGDCMYLPFRENSFAAEISVAALHHLDPALALKETYRILKLMGLVVLLEPNRLNPVSAIGRRLFPMETHTEGEKPFLYSGIKKLLSATGLTIQTKKCIFFMTFPLARAFRLLGWTPPGRLVNALALLEYSIERIPLLERLNSTLIISARKD